MALVLHIPKRQARLVVAAAVLAVMGAGVAARAVPAEGPGATSELVFPAPPRAASASESMRPGGQSPAPQGQAGPPPAAQDPAQQQGQPPQGEPAQQAGAVPPPVATQQELLTPEERTALALVEQIIRDQEGVLMGTGFSYNRAGRRDPFTSLIAIFVVDGTTGDTPRPAGLPGFLISEVNLKAIATAQGRWHAMVTGPNQRAYFLEVGTELYDGHVVDIRPGEVVFEQLVSDMTGARRTREVTKQLTTNPGGGQTP